MQPTGDRRSSVIVVMAVCVVLGVAGCSIRTGDGTPRDDVSLSTEARAAAERDAATASEAAGLESTAGFSTSVEQACSGLGAEERDQREWLAEMTAVVDPDSANAVIDQIISALRSADGWEIVGDEERSPVWPSAGVMFSHGDGIVTVAIERDSGAVTVSATSGCYGGMEA